MISQETLLLAGEVAKNSLPTGMQLKAIEGTALAQIVDSIRVEEPLVLSTESLDQSLSLVKDNVEANIPYTGTKAFPLIMEFIEKQYMDKFIAQVSFVRNTVNPLVVDITRIVKATVVDKEENAFKININKVTMPNLLANAYIDYVKRFYTGNGFQKGPDYKPNFNALELTIEQLTALLKKEDDGFNEDMVNLANQYQEQYGIDLFTDAFELLRKSTNEDLGGLGASYQNYQKAIVAFVLIDHLGKNPIAGLGLPNDKLSKWCMFGRSAMARVIVSYSNMLFAAIKNNQVISGVNPNKNEVTVYALPYDEWDEADKVEVLMGVLYSEKPSTYFTKAKLIEAHDTLLQRGRLAINSKINISDNQRSLRLVDAITGSITRAVEEAKLDDEHLLHPFINTDEGLLEVRGKVIKFLNAYYPGNRILNVDPSLLVVDVVCELYFKDTLAGTLLKTLTEIVNDNPDATPQEVISLGLIELLTTWVAGQITLVKA